MIPQYRCMESYPFQRNQTPFTPYQASPTPMPMDPAKSGTMYEPWPNGGNYGYPMPCHSCCNHGNFSSCYGFRPYVPAPMPSPVCFGGCYPAPYAEAYPAHYAPPPHYPVDLPRYEYDKRSNHCFGCPHYFYNPKEEKGAKIEEQKPEVVEKKESDSLVPVQMRNYPLPSMWVPQEYLHNKGQRKSFEPEVGEQEKVPPETKQPESLMSCEQEPGYWNGWFPLDMDNLRSLMHGGDGKRMLDQLGKEHQQNKEQKRELPFPAIWMPSYDHKQEVGKNDNRDRNGAKEQQSDEKKKQFPFPIIWIPPFESKREDAGKKSNKDVNSNTKHEETQPSTFNVFPEKYPGDGNSTNESGVNGENHAAQSGVEMKKSANQKTIPVKQIDAHEVDSSEESKERERGFPVEKSSESNARRSSSPPKSPKLPPVCLRVDPLPRKKKGSSRSPSPPSSKSHPQENTKAIVEASACLNEKAPQDSKSHKSVSSCSKEVEPKEKEKKVIKVTEGKISGNDDGDRMDASKVPISLPPKQPIADVRSELHPEKTMEGVIEKASKVSNATAEEAEEASKATEAAKSLREEGKLENKTFSDVEAAVAIQSAYRGFDVRRWEPLKKLKQIAEIREQVVDVRNCIQALDSSCDVQNDNKQKVMIGETVMRLLLKLDAIQGLPPSLRDIRKSLARELVNLQEKLDSFMIKNFRQSETEVSTSKTVDRIDEEVQNRASMLKQEKQEATEHVEKERSLHVVYESHHDTVEPCETQLPHMIDSGHSSGDEETSVSLSQSSVQHTIAKNDLQTLPMEIQDIKHRETNSGPFMEPKDEEVNGELEASLTMVTVTEKAEDAFDPNQFVQVPLAVENTKDSEVQGTNLEASHLDVEELPHGVIDNEPITIEFENDKQIEMDKMQMTPGKDADMAFEVVHVPVELIDQDSEFGKHGQAEMEENENLPGKNKCEGAIDLAQKEVPAEKDEQLDEAAEHSSVVEPEAEERVRVDCEEDEEISGCVDPGKETEHQEGNETINHVPEPEESRVKASLEEKYNGGAKEEPTETDGEANEQLPLTTTEDEGKETHERKVEKMRKLEFMEDEKMQDQEDGFETTKDDEVHAEHVEQEGESPLPASPTYSLVSVDETGTEFETNNKLKEENVKLKEMMEKLLETGKEQLDVISNLTVRVKDLEKKLATTRKKKRRTRTVKRSYIPPVKERVVGVAV